MFVSVSTFCRPIAVCLALAFAPTLLAQETQTRPGLVLIKPQPWSKPDEAVATEFLAYTDRSVKGSSGAGYFELKTKQEDKKQIAAAKIVKFIVYPDLSLYPELIEPDDRAQIAVIGTDLQKAINQYPTTRKYLEPFLAKVNAELAQFDAGKIKRNGVWQEKETFVAGQMTTMGAQLRSDIVKSFPAASFDLANDPHFVALKEMSAKSPSAQAMVTELSALYDSRLRADSRDDLIKRLNENTLGIAEAEGAVARLRSLKPEEDAKSVAFLKKWDADSAVVKDANEKAKPIAEEIEKQFGSVETVDPLPQLNPEIASQAEALNGTLRTFVASNPTPVILDEGRQPVAILRLSEGLKKLKVLFDERQLLEAKDLLDPLTKKSEAIGPNTVKVVTSLQAQVAKKIEEFVRDREEAKLLLNNGKQKESLAKFEAAFALIPDPAVGEQITTLKQALPPEPKK